MNFSYLYNRARREWWATFVQTERMEKARTGSRETRKAGILVQKRRIWYTDLRASDSRLSAKKSLHRRNWGSGFQDQSSRAIRCDPQADVAKVRPVQEKRMQQHQLSGLQLEWKRALPEYQCYLWAGMSTLPPEIHRGNITKCIHLQKGTPASSGAKFGDVETFLWETWP